MTRAKPKSDMRLLRAAWKASSTIARRRFIGELLADQLFSSSALQAPQVRPADNIDRSSTPDRALDDFLSRCIVKSSGDRVQSSVLFNRYVQHCASLAEEPLSQRGFSIRLRERGYVKRFSNLVWWVGVRVIEHGAA